MFFVDSEPLRSFLKLCKDTGLITDTFNAVDADLIFARAGPWVIPKTLGYYHHFWHLGTS